LLLPLSPSHFAVPGLPWSFFHVPLPQKLQHSAPTQWLNALFADGNHCFEAELLPYFWAPNINPF
jgi:hypothetical protein